MGLDVEIYSLGQQFRLADILNGCKYTTYLRGKQDMLRLDTRPPETLYQAYAIMQISARHQDNPHIFLYDYSSL